MAEQAWSIKIVPGTGGNAQFDPDVFGIDPGQPLKAQTDDVVSWDNQTNNLHQITIGGSPITEIIPPWDSSTPGYVIQQTAPATIVYGCSKHSGESGTIDVVT